MRAVTVIFISLSLALASPVKMGAFDKSEETKMSTKSERHPRIVAYEMVESALSDNCRKRDIWENSEFHKFVDINDDGYEGFRAADFVELREKVKTVYLPEIELMMENADAKTGVDNSKLAADLDRLYGRLMAYVSVPILDQINMCYDLVKDEAGKAYWGGLWTDNQVRYPEQLNNMDRKSNGYIWAKLRSNNIAIWKRRAEGPNYKPGTSKEYYTEKWQAVENTLNYYYKKLNEDMWRTNPFTD